jgi:hypothetical protein
MASQYRVRLDDGSEIGPLDLESLKSWYRQGLIGDASPVLREGARGWTPLGQMFPGVDWRGGGRAPAAPRGGPPRRARPKATAPRETAAAPAKRRLYLLVGLAALAVVGAAIALTTLRPRRSEGDAKVIEWASHERRIADDDIGFAIDLPEGWRALTKGNPLVQPPREARLTVGHTRVRALGYLLVDTAPRGVVTADEYLDLIAASRRRQIVSLKELSRTDVRVGALPGRKAMSTWESGAAKYQDTLWVWRDGWIFFALAAWAPAEDAAAAAREMDALVRGIVNQGALAARTQEAVSRVTEEVPHLTPASAETLMALSEAHTLDAPEAFRRSFSLMSQSLPQLSRAEASEFASLTAAIYASVPWKQRAKLEAYFRRVRGRESTSPAEDAEMAQAVKSAVLGLKPARRARLQAIYDKAIRIGLGRG